MKPNVILINCDDLGYGDLSCYNNKVNKTPYISKLAEMGTVFDSAYCASPICSPSRAGLMTGCYPPRVSVNIVLFPSEPCGLSKNEYTMGNLFSDNGYKTKIIGKWHLGDQKEFLPTNFGFDSYYGIPYSNDMGRQMTADGTIQEYPPLPLIKDNEVIQAQPDQRSITERYTEEAVSFIRENKEDNFFLYLAHTHVHLPLYAGQRFVDERDNGDYGACVAETDWSCGVLMNELETLGLMDNTIIIFTSDNGSRGLDGASNAPLKGAKFTTWEGGLRVPFLAVWKNHIKANTRSDKIISHIDLLPTFASILNAPLSENKIDGTDVSATFLNDEVTRDNFVYFGTRNNHVDLGRGSLSAVRKGDYKLYFCRKAHFSLPTEYVKELYNLKTDIGEEHNIYDSYPEIVAQITGIYNSYLEKLGCIDKKVVGNEVRPCDKVANPVPLTTYDENHPYIISFYDKTDRG